MVGATHKCYALVCQDCVAPKYMWVCSIASCELHCSVPPWEGKFSKVVAPLVGVLKRSQPLSGMLCTHLVGRHQVQCPVHVVKTLPIGGSTLVEAVSVPSGFNLQGSPITSPKTDPPPPLLRCSFSLTTISPKACSYSKWNFAIHLKRHTYCSPSLSQKPWVEASSLNLVMLNGVAHSTSVC